MFRPDQAQKAARNPVLLTVCFATATNPMLLQCRWLGAQLWLHSFFRSTQGQDSLLFSFFFYLIVPGFMYPSCPESPPPPTTHVPPPLPCPTQGASKNPMMKEREREIRTSPLAQPLALLHVLITCALIWVIVSRFRLFHFRPKFTL